MPLAGRSDRQRPSFMAVWQACDGHRSVLEVGRVCGLGDFEVTHALFQLVQTGFIHMNAPTPDGPRRAGVHFQRCDLGHLRSRRRRGQGAEPPRAPRCIREQHRHLRCTFCRSGSVGAGAPGRRTHRLEHQVVGGKTPTTFCRNGSYEYVAFALFDAGSQLNKDDEQAHSRRVSDRIMVLAPKT